MTNLYSFVGCDEGPWRVVSVSAARGASLAKPPRLNVVNANVPALTSGASWVLRGFTSNVRYATKDEIASLKTVQPPLDRPEASCAALIPICKSAAWWDLAQDERRRIFEESSRHTAIGLEYLPPVARRLHHSRDLGEPFDFLTWFEFAPEHARAFDELVARLRATEEWNYVEREVDIRLARLEVRVGSSSSVELRRQGASQAPQRWYRTITPETASTTQLIVTPIPRPGSLRVVIPQ